MTAHQLLAYNDIVLSLYRVLIFSQHEVVFTHCDNEYDRSDAFKAMNPLLAFRSLTAHVEHSNKHIQRDFVCFYRATQLC